MDNTLCCIQPFVNRISQFFSEWDTGNPKMGTLANSEDTDEMHYRVKTSNFGRFFAVSLLQHGLCFAPDM